MKRSTALPLVVALATAVAPACAPRVVTAPCPAPADGAAAVAEDAPPVDRIAIAEKSATRGYTLGAPRVVALLPDGDVLFLRTGPRSNVAELFELDAATGAVRVLASASALVAADEVALSPAEKARRERTRTTIRGIVSVEVSDDGGTLVVPLGAEVFVLDRTTGAARALALGDGYPDDPHLAPDGTQLAFVRDGDLWVAPLAGGGAPRRVTKKDGAHVTWGTAEFVAQEELDRTRGYWWSPDGQHLVVQRTDESAVDTLWVADPYHPDAAPTAFRYPRAGTANADVRLAVVPARGGKPVWIDWDRAAFPYVREVSWPARGALTVVVMSRLQNEARVLAVDPKRGTTRTLLSETDPAWVDVVDGPRWLPDGAGFLWASERSGAWELELRAPDGALRTSFRVPGFSGGVQLDEDQGIAWLDASPDPTQAHVVRLDLATGQHTVVSEGAGLHRASVARRGGTWVLASYSADGARTWTAVRKDGARFPLPSVAEEPPSLPVVTLETVALEGRELQAAIVRPRAFDARRRYPVILHVYAGPTANIVWRDPRGYFADQLLADAGFVVVRVDNRGTPRRGREWQRAMWRDPINLALTDQIDALMALGVRHPELDTARVGVRGWSYGGYFAAMAALLRPDVFKAAVAGAPVSDWRFYDTAYSERYLGLPADNPAGYDAASAVKLAARLTRPLMLVHGATDDNVYLVNTLALAEALFRAGKPFDLVVLGTTHMLADPDSEAALFVREIDFMRAHLGQPAPQR